MPTESTTNRRSPPPTPRNHGIFDPWNSASTGHQRAENPYSNTTAWRDTRARKLERQFRSGDCGDETPAPAAFDGTVGPSLPGDADPDPDTGARDKGSGSGNGALRGAGEWRWVSGAEATRSQLGGRDIRSFMAVGKRKTEDDEGVGGQTGKRKRGVEKLEFQASRREESASSRMQITSTSVSAATPSMGTETVLAVDTTSTTNTGSSKEPSTRLFSGTTIYVNGSTLPQISDHKLKHLLVSHGARISISMARKTVSHVIVGQPGAAGTGGGGGLSARKLQQEIERGGWRGVKVVGVDW